MCERWKLHLASHFKFVISYVGRLIYKSNVNLHHCPQSCMPLEYLFHILSCPSNVEASQFILLSFEPDTNGRGIFFIAWKGFSTETDKVRHLADSLSCFKIKVLSHCVLYSAAMHTL